MLMGDDQVRTRADRVERLLRVVCGDEEFPMFVSDAATIWDVASATGGEIAERLTGAYDVVVQVNDLTRLIWELVDWLEAQAHRIR